MLLEGKKALITGGRKGIGRGVAARLAEEGADVGIADVLADEEAERTAERVRSHGRKATVHRADVGRVQEIDALIEAFVSEHGRIDIIMNGAIYPDHTVPLLETEEAHWDNMMNLSLKGYFFASKRAAQRMVEQEPMPGHAHAARGRIINIASVHGYAARKDWTLYGTAKAALTRMTQGLAVDLAGTGVTANCIAPGAINNSLTPDGSDPPRLTDADNPGYLSRIPAQVGGVPRDIANAVVYLCSDMGSYVNGETILVDGGMMAGRFL